MSEDDADADRPGPGPHLPPEDRLWRHPSELGAGGPGAGGPAPVATGNGARRGRLVAAAAGACLAGAAMTAAGLWWGRPPRATRSVLPSTTTILAAPAAVIGERHGPAARRPLLGIEVADATSADGAPAGARVVTVARGGPAARAGLRAGDVVTVADGGAVLDAADLVAHVRGHGPGETCRLAVERDGSPHDVLAVLPG